MKRHALILASGSGERFGAQEVPKHLTLVRSVPVLAWTMRQVADSKLFNTVIVVTREQDRSSTQQCLNEYFSDCAASVTLVTGGGRRIDSFLAGLGHLAQAQALADDDVIALFDANRPMVKVSQLEELDRAASEYGCACPGRGIVNGVASVTDGKIVSVPDKSKFIEFVTPEFIQYGILKRALAEHGDGCLSLVEYALTQHIEPRVVDASIFNAKLTYPEDCAFLEGLVATFELEVPESK